MREELVEMSMRFFTELENSPHGVKEPKFFKCESWGGGQLGKTFRLELYELYALLWNGCFKNTSGPDP